MGPQTAGQKGSRDESREPEGEGGLRNAEFSELTTRNYTEVDFDALPVAAAARRRMSQRVSRTPCARHASRG